LLFIALSPLPASSSTCHCIHRISLLPFLITFPSPTPTNLYSSHLPSDISHHIPLSNYIFIIHIQQFEPVKNRESHAAMSHTTSTRQRISSLKVRARAVHAVIFLVFLAAAAPFRSISLPLSRCRDALLCVFALVFVCLGTATTPLNPSTSILELSN
jgi:hypothetical protein